MRSHAFGARTRLGAVAAALITIGPASGHAADIAATPATYAGLVGTLKPGDTLRLAAGDYARLSISGLDGTAASPITITGPDSGAPAVFHSDPGPCCNTVEIRDSSYVVLKKITVNGDAVDGAFAISAKDGVTHHITIEGCTLINLDTGQQNVGISTKAPAWGWVIRGNTISGAGTGMYLGNSNGADPFVGGLIEGNFIEDTIGYNMQIKFQTPRAAVPGMPTTPSTTIIRHNVFIKNDRPSPDGDRPNLLVGGFPSTGPGSEDRYEIYGNLIVHNPRESLMQVSGRVSIHDNVFVDASASAILLTNHDAPLRQAFVYNNTIFQTGSGIRFASAAPQGDAVFGNLVFGGSPIGGAIADQRDNIVDTVANAGLYVKMPSTMLGAMDFYPLAGKAEGPALDMTKVRGDVAFDRDFNGTSKGTFAFRGAYAGAGTNPGWGLDATPKRANPSSGTDGGVPADGAASDGAVSDAGASDGLASADAAADSRPGATGSDGGCGCDVTGPSRGTGPLAILVSLFVLGVRRRTRRAMVIRPAVATRVSQRIVVGIGCREIGR